MRTRRLVISAFGFAVGLAVCILAARVVYNIPAVNDRLYPRIDALVANVREIVSPHSETIPTPAFRITAPPTFAVDTPTPLPYPRTAIPSNAEQPATLAPTPLPLVYDLPSSVTLTGARYEPQLYNNCGPATLTAGLVFWGWRGSEPDELEWYASGKDVRWQRDIANVIKPKQGDKNVMPYELANYASDYAGLQAAVRYGGDIDLIRRFVANGFPVIIERGFREEEHGQVGQGWQGHYDLITGYDHNSRQLLSQDSFKGKNYWRSYDEMTYDWRDFNYAYLVLYPADRAAEVIALLGPDAGEGANYSRALAKAQAEAQQLADPTDQAFAWFNIGTSLQLLGRSQEAAAAFDQARSFGKLPWRMLWYQTEMYKAYYFSGRYQDVIDLASAVLQTPGLEESHYWRGWAYYQLGDLDRAAADMRAALDAHPKWDQALAALAQWGAAP